MDLILPDYANLNAGERFDECVRTHLDNSLCDPDNASAGLARLTKCTTARSSFTRVDADISQHSARMNGKRCQTLSANQGAKTIVSTLTEC